MDKITAFVGEMPQKFCQKKMPKAPLVIVAIIFGITGVHLLTGSHAATPYVSINADAGTVANGATKQACSGASNGNCVVFGGPNANLPFPACTGTGNTCTVPTHLGQTVSTDDGSGQFTINRSYFLDRPGGLPNDSSHKAALVFLFGGGGGTADWQALAAQYHFVLVDMNNIDPGAYFVPTILIPGAGGPLFKTCGPPSSYPNGTLQCDDVPAVVSIVNKLIATQNIDPNWIFAVGGSKGGGLTEAAMCDTRSTGLFRGFGVMSNYLASYSANVTPVGVGCPTLGWNGNNAPTAPTHTNQLVQWMYGSTDGNLSPPCQTSGCINGKGTWTYSFDQLATLVAGPPMGCSTTPVTSTIGTPSGGNSVKVDDYSNCSTSGKIQIVEVPGNYHSYDGFDGSPYGINNSALIQWNFLTSGGSGH